MTWELAHCPVCRARADTVRHWEGRHILPWHTWGGRAGTESCPASGRTLADARELDALRQRAHP